MNKITVALIFSFILSILIHYVSFMSVNETLKNTKLTFPTTNREISKKNGYTSIKYVKLLKKENIEKKPTKKRETTKSITKKKPLKKKTETKKIKKISKNIKKVKTIKLPQKDVPNLKKLFTIKKEQKTKNRKKEETSIQNLSNIYKDTEVNKKLDQISQQYIKLYGEEFFIFSKEQKRFIRNNINLIGKITEKYLGYPRISIRTKQSGINILEFILYPNGDISDLKLTDSSNFSALDRNSIETIRIAYKDYPKPIEPTKIKIYIKYILR